MGINIADMDHALHFVEGLAKHRDAAVSRLPEQRDQIGKAVRCIERDDVRPRHRDVDHPALTEMKQVLQHLALDRRQIALADDAAVMLLDHFLDLVAKRRLVVTPKQ